MGYDDRADRWSDETPAPRRNYRPRRWPEDDTPRPQRRDPWRRARDRLSGMYDAVSREVQAFRRRLPLSSRRADPGDDWSAYDSRADFDDTGYDDSGYASIAAPRAPAYRPSRALASEPSRVVGVAPRPRARKPRGNVAGCLLYLALSVLVFITVISGVGAGYAYAVYQQYADTITTLSVNRLFQTTRIFDRNGHLLYQTYGQDSGSRTYISYCQMPESIKIATVDTEDATFWTNPGVNFLATLHSAFIDTSTSSSATGASTITQQLVKLNVLGDERRNIGRKMNEAVLALGVTQQYTKPKILEMYLNTIPYGRQNYGIEAAAQNYFHLNQRQVRLDSKDPFDQQYIAYYKNEGCAIPNGATSIWMSAAYQLQPWQAMLLAGIPQAPSLWDMFDNPDGLAHTRMVKGVMRNVQNQGHGAAMFVLPASGQYDLSDPGQALAPAKPDQIASFTFNFITATDANKNPKNIFLGAFQDSSGKSTKLAPHFVDYVINELSDRLPGGFAQFASLGWNIYTTLDYGDPTITTQMLSEMLWDKNTGVLAPYAPNIAKDMKNDPAKIADETAKVQAAIPNVGMEQFAEYVVNRDIDGPFPDYWYCGNNKPLVVETIPSPNPFVNLPNRNYGHDGCWLRGLNGVHNVHNAALTAIDPRNGDILAMVGSVDYNSTDPRVKGQFNVATAPSRSLGSSFKPIVYATAFQMGWTPGIVMRDEPTCFPNDASSQTTTDKYLCPNNYLTHNYERQNWSGAQPITYELGNSLNTPAELALEFAGSRADYTNDVYNMAVRLGIDTLDPTKMGPATALGAQGVPLLEETSAYGTFANGGYHYPPRSILTVTDPLGKPILDSAGHQLFPYQAIPNDGYQAISPEAAYMVTSVLTQNNARVGDFGPNNPLQFFGRDVAAKTGTSQDVVDIVTMGYTPWLALGVWAGNADNSSMYDVIGIAGAGYIFHDVMQFAITRLHMPGTGPSNIAQQEPGGYFPIPKDMHLGIVSCHTGLAPYQGEDVTQQCYPAKDPAPLFMSPEFNGSCDYNCNNVAPLKPNASWYGLGWGSPKIEGCSNGHCVEEQYSGTNTAWLVNGQDPIDP